MNYCSLVNNIFQNLGYMMLGGGVYVYKQKSLMVKSLGITVLEYKLIKSARPHRDV